MFHNQHFVFVFSMRKRTSTGNIAIGVFVLGALLTILAFFSRSWLVSDYRITGKILSLYVT